MYVIYDIILIAESTVNSQHRVLKLRQLFLISKIFHPA